MTLTDARVQELIAASEEFVRLAQLNVNNLPAHTDEWAEWTKRGVAAMWTGEALKSLLTTRQRLTEAERWLGSAMTMLRSRQCPETADGIEKFLKGSHE